MKFNQLSGAENFFYSFEYYGDHSLWNFLFPGEQPPIPRGVTHWGAFGSIGTQI